MISSILSQIGIHSFDPILKARTETLGPLQVSIDGGAGWGDTARLIAENTAEDGLIYAFEPFPGNHRFFDQCDKRIRLIKSAVSDYVGTASFFVPQVVQAHDAWAKRDLVGYSSVGHITSSLPAFLRLGKRIRSAVSGTPRQTPQLLNVNVTRIDEVVHESHIDFIKLDIQGAEYQALLGVGTLLARTDMLWIEFSNQPNLLDLLHDHNFLVFDSNYLCRETAVDDLEKAGLRATRRIMLSTSQPALIAKRVDECDNYQQWFNRARRNAGVMQTDLLAVSPAFLPKFLSILGRIGDTYAQEPASFQD